MLNLMPSNLTDIADEHRAHLQNCLKWQAKYGRGIVRSGQGWNPLQEALTIVLGWIASEHDPRAWQAMVRNANDLWWKWYEADVEEPHQMLPYSLMAWLPRPDEFEAELEALKARVLAPRKEVAL